MCPHPHPFDPCHLVVPHLVVSSSPWSLSCPGPLCCHLAPGPHCHHPALVLVVIVLPLSLLLAPGFPHMSSCLQWWGQVLGWRHCSLLIVDPPCEHWFTGLGAGHHRLVLVLVIMDLPREHWPSPHWLSLLSLLFVMVVPIICHCHCHPRHLSLLSSLLFIVVVLVICCCCCPCHLLLLSPSFVVVVSLSSLFPCPFLTVSASPTGPVLVIV